MNTHAPSEEHSDFPDATQQRSGSWIPAGSSWPSAAPTGMVGWGLTRTRRRSVGNVLFNNNPLSQKPGGCEHRPHGGRRGKQVTVQTGTPGASRKPGPLHTQRGGGMLQGPALLPGTARVSKRCAGEEDGGGKGMGARELALATPSVSLIRGPHSRVVTVLRGRRCRPPHLWMGNGGPRRLSIS